MSYLSLYRKYRSQTFEELSGQEHVVRTLQNAVRASRVAHAYLFTGPRGTGKTSSARLLAKSLNCRTGPTATPCNECDACLQITEGRFLDVKEVDAATNRGIDEIRELRDQVAYTPAGGRFKVYIIDEVHQITSDAFNALLKTLEEPPPHVVFVLATTEPQKIPATIASRCQRFDFHRATLGQLRECIRAVAVKEGYEIEESALSLIARQANGGWRDALSLLEQVLAYSQGAVSARDVTTVLGTVDTDTLFALSGHLAAGEGGEAYRLVDQQIAEGKDPRQMLRELTGHFRLAMLAGAGCESAGDTGEGARFQEMAQRFGRARVLRAVEWLAQAERDARWSEQPRLLLEIALGQIMLPPAESSDRPPARESSVAAAPAARAPSPARRTPAPERRQAPAEVRETREPAAAEPETPPPPDDYFEPAEAAAEPAPAPQLEPPPAADAPPAPREIELIQRKWRLVGEELKRDRKKTIESMLVDTMPHRFEDEVLVIHFPKKLMAELFTKRGKEFSEPLCQAIRRLTGIQCRVRAEFAAGETPARPPAPAPPSPRKAASQAAAPPAQPELIESAPAQAELIHDIIELFDGRIVDPSDFEKR